MVSIEFGCDKEDSLEQIFLHGALPEVKTLDHHRLPGEQLWVWLSQNLLTPNNIFKKYGSSKVVTSTAIFRKHQVELAQEEHCILKTQSELLYPSSTVGYTAQLLICLISVVLSDFSALDFTPTVSTTTGASVCVSR